MTDQTDQPTALDLPMVDPLPESTQKYFDICQDKLGMVPNVLLYFGWDDLDQTKFDDGPFLFMQMVRDKMAYV